MAKDDTQQVPEVINVDDTLRQMVLPLRQALEQGEQHVLFLEGVIKDQRAKNSQVKSALRAVDPDYKPQPKPKRPVTSPVGITRKNGTASGFGVTIEVCEPWVEKIKEIVKRDGFATQRDVYESLKSDQGISSGVFRYLRHIGFLGKNGRDKATKREKWIVMDEDAYDQVLQELKEQKDA